MIERTVCNPSPLKAIRAKCLSCCLDNANEVRLCPIERCPLHPYRFGKNPYSKRKPLTPEQREAAAKRLREARMRKDEHHE